MSRRMIVVCKGKDPFVVPKSSALDVLSLAVLKQSRLIFKWIWFEMQMRSVIFLRPLAPCVVPDIWTICPNVRNLGIRMRLDWTNQATNPRAHKTPNERRVPRDVSRSISTGVFHFQRSNKNKHIWPTIPANLPPSSEARNINCNIARVSCQKQNSVAGWSTVTFYWYYYQLCGQCRICHIWPGSESRGFSTTQGRTRYLSLYLSLSLDSMFIQNFGSI